MKNNTIKLTDNYTLKVSTYLMEQDKHLASYWRLIQKAAGLDISNVPKNTRVSNSLWRNRKNNGVLKGTQENPKFAWKVQGIISLSKKFPHLNFTSTLQRFFILDSKAEGKNHSGTVLFQTVPQFYERIRNMASSFDIFEHPSMLHVLSDKEIQELSLTLQNFQVTLDRILEER